MAMYKHSMIFAYIHTSVCFGKIIKKTTTKQQMVMFQM